MKASEYRVEALKAMGEGEFQAEVIAEAQGRGWLVAHFRPARTDQGWRTAVSADGRGFPDLVLARRGEVIFVEVKSESGRTSVDQRVWLQALGKAAYVFKPSDWPQIVQVLA